MVEANVDVSRVRPGCIRPAVSFITLLVTLLVAFLSKAWGHFPRSTTTRSRKALVCKYFATHRTSAPERASVDWWPSWYKGDEVVATMQWYEKDFIAEALKIERWSWQVTCRSKIKLMWQDHIQPVIMTLKFVMSWSRDLPITWSRYVTTHMIYPHDPDTWSTNFILTSKHHRFQYPRHPSHVMTTP